MGAGWGRAPCPFVPPQPPPPSLRGDAVPVDCPELCPRAVPSAPQPGPYGTTAVLPDTPKAQPRHPESLPLGVCRDMGAAPLPCGGSCPRGDCGAERDGPGSPWELLRRGCPCPTVGMDGELCPTEQGTGRGSCPTEGWKTDPVPQNKAQREGPAQTADGGRTLPHRTRHRERVQPKEGMEDRPFPTEQGTGRGPTAHKRWKTVPSTQNKAQGKVPPHRGAGRGSLPHRTRHRAEQRSEKDKSEEEG